MNLKDQAVFTANALDNFIAAIGDSQRRTINIEALQGHVADLRAAADAHREFAMGYQPFEYPPATEMLASWLRRHPYDRDDRELHQIIGRFSAEAQKPLHDLLVTLTTTLNPAPWEKA